jgi:hypothetical protein
MTMGKVFGRPRCSQILFVAALAAVAIAAAPSLRERIQRAVGWAIVVGESEPVVSADIIVVSLHSGGAGALEAADLDKAASLIESLFLWILRRERASSTVGDFSKRVRARGKSAN